MKDRLLRTLFGDSPVALCGLALVLVVTMRLATLGLPGLLDATEGRYASIAQTMVQSGDWVTPQIRLESGVVPFWGKPPLQFWLTAASLKVFGMNEWAARFACFLPGILMALMTWFLARSIYCEEVARLSALILITTGLTFCMAGSVTIDVTLSCCVTGAMLGFAKYLWSAKGSRCWGLSIFFWLALGFLTKGPVAIVLFAMPVGLWTIATSSWRKLWALPWFSGLTLFLVLVVPWFVLAERATPGFLKYFFYEENFRRFTTKNYLDLYGSGHRYTYGTSWFMLLLAFLPWTIPALVLLVSQRTAIRKMEWRKDQSVLLLVLWGASAALFFTLARQILINYLMPALPALAVLLAAQFSRQDNSIVLNRVMRWQIPVLIGVGLLVFGYGLWDAPRALSVLAPLAISIPVAIIVMKQLKAAPSALRLGSVAALITGTLFAVIIISGGREAESRSSTRLILSEVREDLRASGNTGPVQVGVVDDSHYSAYFYTSNDSMPNLEIVQIQEADIPKSNVKNFIIRNREHKRMSGDIKSALRVRSTIGNWTWLVK